MNLKPLSQWRRNFGDMDGPARQRLLFIVTSLVVGLWAGDRLLLGPLTSAWSARADQIRQLRQQIANGEQLLERESAIRSRWQQMQTNALPSSVSQAEGKMLGAIDRWSRSSQISVSSVKPQWKRNDDYAALECRVDAAGSLATITRFLYEIEQDPLAMKVDIVELNSRDATGSQISLGVQINGLVLNPEERTAL